MTLSDISKAIDVASRELLRARSRGDHVNADIWASIETRLVDLKAKRLGLD